MPHNKESKKKQFCGAEAKLKPEPSLIQSKITKDSISCPTRTQIDIASIINQGKIV